jgi:hypothetical protein
VAGGRMEEGEARNETHRRRKRKDNSGQKKVKAASCPHIC